LKVFPRFTFMLVLNKVKDLSPGIQRSFGAQGARSAHLEL
jgi:hypothetical protein